MSNQLQTRRVLPRLRQSESLGAIVSQGGPLPEEQVWSVVDKLLHWLELLHSQGKCHRCFSLSTIGIDAAGELEIATTDAALSISDLVRLHAPLPSCLRHEFDLVLSSSERDAAIALAHAGFGGNAAALDLFQVAVLTVRLIFDVDGEKFLASPCLQETLTPALCKVLKGLLAADQQVQAHPRTFRTLLPGATTEMQEAANEAPEYPTEGSIASVQEIAAVEPPVAECNCSRIPSEANISGPIATAQNDQSLFESSELVVPPITAPALPTDAAPKTQLANSPLSIWTVGALVFAVIVVGAIVAVWVFSG